MNNLDFINLYRKQKTVYDLCKENNILYSNLVYGKSTKEKERIIANLCKQEIMKMFNDLILSEVIKNA